MIDLDALHADLAAVGGDWSGLAERLEQKIRDGVHGDLPRWQSALDGIRRLAEGPFDEAACREHLAALSPWRKGPFHLRGIQIDAEWRSDRKWKRVERAASPLAGRRVLDVGSGNGFYARRMRAAGAAVVIGVDPSLLFLAQFSAVQLLEPVDRVHVLPCTLEELPHAGPVFDTVFSMGVLYHRRDPAAHLADLRRRLAPGGELVLESLIIPGEGSVVLKSPDRYARMRNVWHLPTATALVEWLHAAGFRAPRLADVSQTTVDEQRSTIWMPFESLSEALDPDDPSLTVEGLPAPTRALLVAAAPLDAPALAS